MQTDNISKWDKYQRVTYDFQFIMDKLENSQKPIKSSAQSINYLQRIEERKKDLAQLRQYGGNKESLKQLENEIWRLETLEKLKDFQESSEQFQRVMGLSFILPSEVNKAKDLINSCKPKLTNIKNTLGSSDHLYLKVSSAVMSKAQGILVSVVNQAQKGYENFEEHRLRMIQDISGSGIRSKISNRDIQLSTLYPDTFKEIVRSVYYTMTSMQSMDLLSDFRQLFQKNYAALMEICQTNNIDTRSPK